MLTEISPKSQACVLAVVYRIKEARTEALNCTRNIAPRQHSRNLIFDVCFKEKANPHSKYPPFHRSVKLYIGIRWEAQLKQRFSILPPPGLTWYPSNAHLQDRESRHIILHHLGNRKAAAVQTDIRGTILTRRTEALSTITVGSIFSF